MAFEELLYKAKSESELAYDVANEILRKYLALQGQFYFIKLGRLDSERSQILWVRTFLSNDSLDNFFFDTKLQRACIIISHESAGHYKIETYGFSTVQQLKVFPDQIVELMNYKISYNIEEDVMMTREQIARLLGQAVDAVVASGTRKAG